MTDTAQPKENFATADLIARFALFGLAAVSLSAGVEETVVAPAPSAADHACLAVGSRAGNSGDATLLESNSSEAGTQVIVGLGPDKARWQPIAHSDGTTAAVKFMGANG